MIVGDSMLHEIVESRLPGVKPNLVKVKDFLISHYRWHERFAKVVLNKRPPTNIILHADTNTSISDSSSVTLSILLSLKNFIHSELPESNGVLLFTTHDPTIHDPTMHNSCINYPNQFKLCRKTINTMQRELLLHANKWCYS